MHTCSAVNQCLEQIRHAVISGFDTDVQMCIGADIRVHHLVGDQWGYLCSQSNGHSRSDY